MADHRISAVAMRTDQCDGNVQRLSSSSRFELQQTLRSILVQPNKIPTHGEQGSNNVPTAIQRGASVPTDIARFQRGGSTKSPTQCQQPRAQLQRRPQTLAASAVSGNSAAAQFQQPAAIPTAPGLFSARPTEIPICAGQGSKSALAAKPRSASVSADPCAISAPWRDNPEHSSSNRTRTSIMDVWRFRITGFGKGSEHQKE